MILNVHISLQITFGFRYLTKHIYVQPREFFEEFYNIYFSRFLFTLYWIIKFVNFSSREACLIDVQD